MTDNQIFLTKGTAQKFSMPRANLKGEEGKRGMENNSNYNPSKKTQHALPIEEKTP